MYDGDGIVNQITPPAQEPWNLSFTTLPGDAGKGRLAAVSRSALTAGTAVSTIVYRVPTSGSGAPYGLSAGQTIRWAQDVPSIAATAICPPTQIPDGNQATGTVRRGGRRPDPDDPMFTYPDGRAVRPDWLTREFQRRCAELDLPPVRLHDLRHGAVSLAGAAGTPLKVMQHDAGHSTAITTADTYYHVFAETAHAAVAETAALLLAHAKIRMSLAGASQA